MPHIYDSINWPLFAWNADAVTLPLSRLRYKQGLFARRCLALDEDSRRKAEALVLAADAAAGAALGGEGSAGALAPVMDDIARHSASLLTAARLFAWHRALDADSGGSVWREAPSAKYPAMPPGRLPDEIKTFLSWFNFDALPQRDAAPASPALWREPVLRAGIAQLWFAALRPFEYGSLRLARAVGDLALLRADPGKAWYSLNEELLRRRADYYAALHRALEGPPDITPWLLWFLEALEAAVDSAEERIAPAIKRGKAFDRMQKSPLNARQKLVLSLLLDGGKKKRIRSGDYARAAACSSDTALRDIQELLELDFLRKNRAGGRSTSYSLKM